jgi:MbtH protein
VVSLHNAARDDIACGSRWIAGEDIAVSNPFDDENLTFFVLVNDEGQHSLWPTAIDVPPGWSIVHDESSRQECLDYVDHHWTDMRPRSLRDAMEGSA